MPFAFAYPLILLAFLALPLAWWWLRHTPPRPQNVVFAPIHLLAGLIAPHQTQHTPPWWWLAVRLLLISCLILAFSAPSITPTSIKQSNTSGLILIIDSGWPMAAHWPQRKAVLQQHLAQAHLASTPVWLILSHSSQLAAQPAEQAKEALETLTLQPFIPERDALLAPLQAAIKAMPDAQIIWASDGVASQNDEAFLGFLRGQILPKNLTVLHDDAHLPSAITQASQNADALNLQIERLTLAHETKGQVQAVDAQGRTIIEQSFAFSHGQNRLTLSIPLPIDLRNEIVRLRLANPPHAGGVFLLDERWKRKSVALISGTIADPNTPLLSASHFLRTALAPFAHVRELPSATLEHALEQFMAQKVAVIVLTECGAIPASQQAALSNWLEQGGILLRFADTKITDAAAQMEPSAPDNPLFLPLQTRPSLRTLSGTLTWDQPQTIAPFAKTSPFAGLLPASDVVIRRQIISPLITNTSAQIWAELSDGTPLVSARAFTAKKEQKTHPQDKTQGWSVLVHVAAHPDWSNLPLSGTFMQMLQRLVNLAAHTPTPLDTPQTAAVTALPLWRALTAQGQLVLPSTPMPPVSTALVRALTPTPLHPPGLYGTNDTYLAVNALSNIPFQAIFSAQQPPPIAVTSYDLPQSRALTPFFLILALMLFMLDSALVLWQKTPLFFQERSAFFRSKAALSLFILASSLIWLPLSPSCAQDTPHGLRLAYLKSGNPELDRVSQAGLNSLAHHINQRTSVRVSSTIGLDPAQDELAFYPLIYWPLQASSPALSAQALRQLAAYMKNGGTLLCDTQDQDSQIMDAHGRPTSPNLDLLKALLSQLDAPTMAVVPPHHVLTKTFYLLDSFKGRFSEGMLWSERLMSGTDPSAQHNSGDGISPLLITSNDMASAWAADESGQALLPLDNASPRQREMAVRAGINIVLYTLTGNYKADQVHVRDILDRMSQ